MKIYFNQAADEDFGIYSENNLYDAFLNDKAWVHTPENYPLWKKINTDATVSDCPRFLCIDTDNRADVDHCSVDMDMAKVFIAMENNLNFPGDAEDADDYPEPEYKVENGDMYDAYWELSFVSPRNHEVQKCKIAWGATEYEELSTALKNILSEF